MNFYTLNRHSLLLSHRFDFHFVYNIYIYIRMIYASLMFFYSFIAVIMLSTLSFKSSVLFKAHTLLDKSFRILQLLTHLSNITENE